MLIVFLLYKPVSNSIIDNSQLDEWLSESIRESLEGTVLQDGTLMMPTDSTISTAVIELIEEFVASEFLMEIGMGAFANTLISEIVIPESVQVIDDMAFYNCENLCEVKGATGVIVIEEVAFYACTSLARFDLPETLRTIGNEAFGACESLVEVKLPEKIESVGLGAFSYCSSLSRLDLGGLTEVPEKAFLRCTSLGKVVIGENVTSIGVQAFRGCDVLKNVHIDKSVKYIGGAAFSTCPLIEIGYSGSESNWKKIKMPAGAEEFANITVNYKQKLDKAN